MKIDVNTIQKLIGTLAAKRCVFCSEMDFQIHLAWLMKEMGYELSLEYNPECFDANASIDIMIWKPERVVVELKYKTTHFKTEDNGHPLHLKNHSARDIGRYDFIKDISRVEHVVSSGKADRGFAIFLTNDSGYWRPGRVGTADEMFHMFDGRPMKNGTFEWGPNTGDGTKRGREKSLTLIRDYVFGWKDYAVFGEGNGLFRFLIIDVESLPSLSK